MPYEVIGNCVHKVGNPKPIPGGCHDTPKEAYAQMSAIMHSEGMMGKALNFTTKAVWTTAQVDDFPDSSFLYIEGGGKKDEQGKTVPRSLRKFPYKDGAGKVDMPHLRNAIARIPQSDISPDLKTRLQARARQVLMNMRSGE